MRAMLRVKLVGPIFAGMLLVLLLPPAVWASSPYDDHSEETPLLTVVTDFNRDGVADVARVASTDRDHGGLGVLTISLMNADGSSIPS